jgi:hypothetical protein
VVKEDHHQPQTSPTSAQNSLASEQPKFKVVASSATLSTFFQFLARAAFMSAAVNFMYIHALPVKKALGRPT